jgi:hypothetical protein
MIVHGQPAIHAHDVGVLDLSHQVGVLSEGLQRPRFDPTKWQRSKFVSEIPRPSALSIL